MPESGCVCQSIHGPQPQDPCFPGHLSLLTSRATGLALLPGSRMTPVCCSPATSALAGISVRHAGHVH